MKFTKILIFVLIFGYISCRCSNISFTDLDIIDVERTAYYIDPTASKSSCINRELSSEEIEADAYKCCYYNINCKIKVDQLDPEDREDLDNTAIKGQFCTTITKDDFDNLKSTKKPNLDLILDCKAYDLECDSSSFSFSSSSSSSYLGLSIIYLILFLLY